VTEGVLVQTKELVKEYSRRRVVNGVNLEVRKGEIVGLLGPNGAGKTTSFYMIVGLVRPTAGQVFFQGQDVTRLPMYRRARMGMGYLAQEPSIFRRLTVEENVMAILETLPLSAAERRKRLQFLLEELKISHLAKQRAYTLSGGERRRLEITRALVTNPALILLDEPFSGVDPLAVHDVQQIVIELRERGLGILITDHNVRETLAVVDRAYLICEGKVLREGTSNFLVNDPVSRELYLGPRFSM
jgi:lipopolysaccharide export system ATP-binding protein